jgi:hypothetical protein
MRSPFSEFVLEMSDESCILFAAGQPRLCQFTFLIDGRTQKCDLSWSILFFGILFYNRGHPEPFLQFYKFGVSEALHPIYFSVTWVPNESSTSVSSLSFDLRQRFASGLASGLYKALKFQIKIWPVSVCVSLQTL